MRYVLYDNPQESKQPDYSQETAGQSVARNVARGVSTGVKTIGDLPYDIAQTGLNTAQNLGQGFEQLQQANPEQLRKFQRPQQEGHYQAPELLKLGSQAVGQAEKFLPEGYLKPQDTGIYPEKLQDALVESFATVANPFFGNKIGAAKALKAAVGGEVANWLGKEVGGSEALGKGLKLGTMVALSTFDKSKLKEFKNAAYKRFEENLDPGLRIPVNKELSINLNNELENARSRLPTATNKEHAKILKSVQDKVGHKTANVKQLWEAKKDVAEELYAPNVSPKLRHYYGKIIGNINEALSEGLGVDYKDLKSADAIHKGIKKAEEARELMTQFKDTKPLAWAMFGSLAGAKAAGGAILGSKAVGPAYEIFQQLKNPEIRKYYTEVAKNAALKNVPGMLRSANRLETVLEKKQPSGQEQQGRYLLYS